MTGAKTPVKPPERTWRALPVLKGARWLAGAYCLLPPMVVVAFVLASHGDPWLAWAEVFLGASALLSLRLLRIIPFPSPVHAPVLLFQWWFGVGPAAISLYAWLGGDHIALQQILGGQAAAVLIVGLGLPLYVAGARVVFHFWPRDRVAARSLAPAGPTYSRVGLVSLLLLWAFSLITQQIAALAGLKAFETVGYLGYVQTSTWWLAPIAALGQTALLLQVVLIGQIFIPSVKRSLPGMVLTIGIVLYALGVAILSGWKGTVMQLFATVLVSYMMWRRRVPWLALIAVALLYLLLVEPFVAQTRLLAERQQITTAQERTELFKEQLLRGAFSVPGAWKDVNISSPFRGIYDFAGRVTERSSVLQGPWGGLTISWGLSTVVPRVLATDKQASNMGNFFDRELRDAASINSVALSIPFEVVGNWGWLSGIVTFAFIGAAWTGFSLFWLTPQRVSTHPLMPFFFLTAMSIETALGSFLAILRNLSIALIAFWLLMAWLGRPRLRHAVVQPVVQGDQSTRTLKNYGTRGPSTEAEGDEEASE